MEPKIAIREIKKKYDDLGKKIKSSYFNPILRSFLKDALKCKNIEEEKEIFSSYKSELQSEFKQMDLDLSFCLNGVREVTKALHDFNKTNKGENKDE